MLGFLRLVRGFCGLVFALQILGAFGTLLALSQVENISPNDETSVFAFIFIKIIFAVIFGFPYFYLRKVINNIHQKQNGDDELLLKSNWSL